jgi:nitrite reductase/ring-hydroxylating ferredoxin subunit
MSPAALQAPPLARFAPWPAGWYGCGPVAGLERGPRPVRVGGEEQVLFRSASGTLGALGRRCPHLGAELSRGEACGELLRCPFHGWLWDGSGRCRGTPDGPAPDAAGVTSWPTAQAGGLTFAFAGSEPLFPLPWFEGPAAARLLCAAPFRVELGAPWFMVGANAFDPQHLGQVHGRQLLGPLEVDQPSPHCRRSRYRSQVTGTAVADRLLRRLAGATVQVSISVWAGTLVLVEAHFPRAVSRVLICVEPLDGWRCSLEVFTVVPRLGGALLTRAVAALRASFVRAFVGADVERLANLGYRPGLLLEADRPLVEYLSWAAELPAAQAAPRGRLSAGRMR